MSRNTAVSDDFFPDRRRFEPISLARLRDEVLAIYDPDAGMASRKHHGRLRLVFDQLQDLGIERSDQLDLDLILRFKASRPPGQSPHYLKSLLSSLRTICSHAETARYVEISPFRIKGMKHWVRTSRPTGRRHCSAPEIRLILDTMKADIEARSGWGRWRAQRLYALTAVVAYTGLRASEAQRLHVADLDLEGGLIHVRPHDRGLKTAGSEAAVAMPPALKPILETWLKDRLSRPKGFKIPPPEAIPWLIPTVRRAAPWTSGFHRTKPLDRLKAVAARAGVFCTFQMLRRSWAVHAEKLGLPQGLTTRQLRHTDIRTTREWYQERDLDNLRGAVEHFDF